MDESSMCALGGAVQGYDGQMFSPAMELDFKFHPRARWAANQCPWPRARRAARPSRTWFITRTAIRRECFIVNLVGCFAAERHMRTMDVVPLNDRINFALESFAAIGNQEKQRQYSFKCKNESLDHGSRTMLSDRAIARRLDAFAAAPLAKAGAIELRASIADDVLWDCLGFGHRASQGTRGWQSKSVAVSGR